MKQLRTLLVAVFLIAACVGSADGQAAAKLFGITGGGTYTNFGSTTSNSTGGGIVGLMVGMRNWNHTVTTLEVSWAQSGDAATRLETINVPVLFGGSRELGDGIRVRGYTGLQVGYNISCSSEAVSLRNCDQVNKWQWHWPVGLQLGKYTPSGTFFAADVRYAWGINDAFENSIAYNRGWEFKIILGKSR